MNFLSAFRRVFGDDPLPPNDDGEIDAVEILDGDGDPHHAAPAEMATPAHASDYDRALWRRKLRTHLAEGHDLTASQWADFFADARALGLEPDWIEAAKRSELRRIIKDALHDGVIDPSERRHLSHAMSLLGVGEAEAKRTLIELQGEARKARERDPETQGAS